MYQINLPTKLGVSGNFLLCSVSNLNLINTSIPQYLIFLHDKYYYYINIKHFANKLQKEFVTAFSIFDET